MTEQSQSGTRNQSGPRFPFPPHRRRHLQSDTYCTLVRILSLCHDAETQDSHSSEVVSEEPKQGGGGNEVGQAMEPEECGETVGPTCVDSGTSLMERDLQSFEEVGIDQCFHKDRMDVNESDNVNGISEGHSEGHGITCGNTLEDQNPNGNFVPFIGDQEGQCNLQEMCMEELANKRQVDVDKEKPSCEVTESLDLCLDVDIIDEFQKLHENYAEGSSFVEEHVLEEVGHEMGLMKLEKLVPSCSDMNSPVCGTADGEIEEGEISGKFGLYDQSTDLLLEDAVSLEQMKVGDDQTSEAIFDEEQVKAQNGANRLDTKCSKNFVETIVNVCNGVEFKLKGINTSEMEGKSETVVCARSGDAKMAHGYDPELESRKNKKQDIRTNEKFNHPAAPGNDVLLCYDDVYPAVPGEMSGRNTTDNQDTLSTKKDAGVREKRKRGPLTKEKKAKKKTKERIKRAEKNKRLGVKRLKIQPVMKPKTVTYCRHFLKGRCHEGEKCKFSHDTIPLTKAQPCCHFARHSCMKGDDCPFDHQLSKYPCNNFLSKGSCSRGTDCLFSHEMQPKEDSPSTINVSKPQLKSPSPLRSTNSEKQLNLQTSSNQKVDSNSGSTVITRGRDTEQTVAQTILKPALQTPKGISKLMFGKSSLGNASLVNQASSLPKADSGAKFGLPLMCNTPDMAHNSNENRRMAVATEPKGINFLSFGKAPLHDSSSKKPSILSSGRDGGIQKSTFGDSSMDKQAALSSQKADGLKVGNQTGQSAGDAAHNLSEMPNRTPAVAPRGINFLSFGKAPSDDAGNMKLASSVQGRESASELQIPSAKPWSILSSSLHSDKSLNQTNEHGKDASGSALKALFSNTSNSAQKGNLSNMPNSSQKSLQSMLAFAAKYESRIKMDTPAVSSDANKASSSSQNASRGSTVLDFLYSGASKSKQ